jgi:PAS domain S-box-containing protein
MTKPSFQRAASTSNAAGGWHAAFVDALPDAVIALDAADGRIITANPAALRLFNTRFDVLCGQHFSSLLPSHSANTMTPVNRRFRLTGELAETETFVDADGTELLCDAVAMPVRDGDTDLVVLHLRDVREREARRRALIEAERAAAETEATVTFSRTVDQYMGHFSHEMKTPLAVILSSSSMLERYYIRLSDHKREEHFSRIQAQVRYLTELLDNLRFLSHLDSRQVVPRRDDCDVVELLEEMINAYAGHPQQPLFDVQADGTVNHLNMDGPLWRRIVSHLISNAVKYGPHGGTVHVSVNKRHDGALETRVSDHGPGLPAEFETGGFELFRRGRNVGDTQGGGLGLTIAARCVALLGGHMTYETAPNAGAAFTVIIPVE